MAASLVLGALQHVWRSLEPFHLPMAVMGGIALAAWQHVRATRDVDILLTLQSTDLDALLQSLAAAHIEPKRQPSVVELGSLRIAGRMIDRADAIALLRLNKAALDYEYLVRWAQDLGLESEWTAIWLEAAPGEGLPPWRE
jgi:hypothetical protein